MPVLALRLVAPLRVVPFTAAAAASLLIVTFVRGRFGVVLLGLTLKTFLRILVIPGILRAVEILFPAILAVRVLKTLAATRFREGSCYHLNLLCLCSTGDPLSNVTGEKGVKPWPYIGKGVLDGR